jgi:hypothetical protein
LANLKPEGIPYMTKPIKPGNGDKDKDKDKRKRRRSKKGPRKPAKKKAK